MPFEHVQLGHSALFKKKYVTISEKPKKAPTVSWIRKRPEHCGFLTRDMNVRVSLAFFVKFDAILVLKKKLQDRISSERYLNSASGRKLIVCRWFENSYFSVTQCSTMRSDTLCYKLTITVRLSSKLVSPLVSQAITQSVIPSVSW